MSDSLFLRSSFPLTSFEGAEKPISTAILPNGDQARLLNTAAGEFVLSVFGPSDSAAKSQVTLVVPDGQQISGAQLVVAPNGNVAVVVQSYTEGSPEGFLRRTESFVNVSALSDDGSMLSAPLELVADPASSKSWYGFVYFNSGDVRFVETVTTIVGDYVREEKSHVWVTPDGTVTNPVMTASADFPEFQGSADFEVLPDGRMAVLSEFVDSGEIETAGKLYLQILNPGGSSAQEPQFIAMNPGFIGITSATLLVLADGRPGIVWMNTEGDSTKLQASFVNADGELQPAVDISSFGDNSPDFTTIEEVKLLSDGTFGVLMLGYLDMSGEVQILYQRFEASGTAVTELVAIETLPNGGQRFQASILPDGGVSLLRAVDTSDGGSTVWARFFDETANALGPATLIDESGLYIYTLDTQVLSAGGAQFIWSGEGGDRQAQTGVGPVSFRPLSDGADTVRLDTPDAVDGLAGNDEIIGSAGTDRMLGSGGDDTLDGGNGDDFLHGGNGSNLLIGGEGFDAAYLAGAFDAFRFAINDDGSEITITGEASIDTARTIERFDFTDQNVTAGQILTMAGFYDVSLVGTADADNLVGGVGNDTIDGAGGADTLNGGDGNDLIIGGPAEGDLRDVIYAGSGDDSVDSGAGNDLVYAMDGNDTIAGGAGADELQGQNGDDVITGSAFSDLVFGGAGNDFVNGGFGHDRINGGAGADKIFHVGGTEDQMLGHGSDWVQDYNAVEGDVLLFGDAAATRDQFQVNNAHTENGEGERSGDDTVEEAFVIYRPTGQILWALVDGDGQAQINLQIGTEVFDLLV